MSALMIVFLRLSGVEFYSLVNRTSNRVEKNCCVNIFFIPFLLTRPVMFHRFSSTLSHPEKFENLTPHGKAYNVRVAAGGLNAKENCPDMDFIISKAGTQLQGERERGGGGGGGGGGEREKKKKKKSYLSNL